MEYTGETVNLEPEWEPTCEWFAEAMAQHTFEQWAYSPVVSFMEQVRFLALTDPDALERIMERLKRKEKGFVHAE
jgi:hypothetical protein